MGVYWLIRARSAVWILWIISNMYVGIRNHCDVAVSSSIARELSISLEVDYPQITRISCVSISERQKCAPSPALSLTSGIHTGLYLKSKDLL
jgi:hypothetical protein